MYLFLSLFYILIQETHICSSGSYLIQAKQSLYVSEQICGIEKYRVKQQKRIHYILYWTCLMGKVKNQTATVILTHSDLEISLVKYGCQTTHCPIERVQGVKAWGNGTGVSR
jgi:hypothetical protein